MILLSAWIVAVIAVSVGYWIAGPIWIERHSLKFRHGNVLRRCSGAIGEAVIITSAALLVIAIDMACRDVDFDGVVNGSPLLIAGYLLAVGAIIYIYGTYTALKAPKEQRIRLLGTYFVYNIYSIILFVGGLIMVTIMIRQASIDSSAFRTASDDLIASVGALQGQAIDTVMRGIEVSNLRIEALLSKAEDSMSPVFVLLAGIFAINIAIRSTPLRSLFMNNAILLTQISTLIGVAIVLGVGGTTYVNYYSQLIGAYTAELDLLQPTIEAANLENLQRFSDIYLDKQAKQSVVGFITRMANEWGGLAAILGIAQWISEQFQKRESAPSSADLCDLPPETEAV